MTATIKKITAGVMKLLLCCMQCRLDSHLMLFSGFCLCTIFSCCCCCCNLLTELMAPVIRTTFFFSPFSFLHVISQILKSSWRRCSRGWGSASGWIKADVNGECKFASPSFMLKLQIESLAGEFCPRALAPALVGAGERIAWSHWWLGRPAPSALKLINLLKPWQIFSCSFFAPSEKAKEMK